MIEANITATSAESGTVRVDRPEVENFLDYREYLRVWLEYKKKHSPGYSGAQFARRAKIKSAPLLGLVIRNERNLSYAMIQSFARALELDARETRFFEKLVLFNQAQSAEERAVYLKQLAPISKSNQVKVQALADYHDFVGSWYIVAIRELVTLRNFRSDPSYISKKLKGAITPKQAEKAWQTLQRLGMVRKENDQWVLTSGKIEIDPKEVSLAIQEFHKSVMDRVRRSIDEESKDERTLGALTIAVDREEFEIIRERVQEFRKSLNEQFAITQSKRDCVVAIQFQAIILTDSKEY